MHPSVRAADIAWERVDIGRKQLPHSPVLQYGFNDGAAVREFQKRLFVSRPVALDGTLGLRVELQFLKNQFSHLLGRADIESRVTGDFPYKRLLFCHSLAKAFCEFVKTARVNAYARLLHTRKHMQQRLFNFIIQLCFTAARKLLIQFLRKHKDSNRLIGFTLAAVAFLRLVE